MRTQPFNNGITDGEECHGTEQTEYALSVMALTLDDVHWFGRARGPPLHIFVTLQDVDGVDANFLDGITAFHDE